MTGRILLTRRRVVAAGLVCAAGGGLRDARAQSRLEQKFPDVIAAKITPRGGDLFDFDVTLSSPYDTPQRYADAFRVTAPDGRVLGERILLHDHETEQPFTRDLYGVKIPSGLKGVVVEGRDQKHGWGGKRLDMALPGR